MGIECEFGFVMGRDFPAANETADIAAVRSAIAECFVGLELVGRRVAPDVPLNERTAIAAFSLDVAVVRGAAIPEWERHNLAAVAVRAVVDGATLASGTGAAVLGHPVNSLLWLAVTLSKRGQRLHKGEIVFTGTCTGITKVAAGQLFEGRFADFPAVEVRLA